MNGQATLQLMHKLKLNGMASSYEGILQLPLDKHPEMHECIAMLVDAEMQNRAYKRTQMLLRLSKLRYTATLQEIVFDKGRNLTKAQIAQLADCAFIDRAENLFITGATGCGKSFLSCAIGNQACLMGYRTMYFNMNRLVEQIAVAQVDGSFVKWLNRLQRARLIIIDDFGLQPLTQQVKLALLQILEDRYARAATIIASQLPVSTWYEYIDDATIADAIMDRLTAKASRIELKGKSLRKRSQTP
jgi:DNA replication protein DnaC